MYIYLEKGNWGGNINTIKLEYHFQTVNVEIKNEVHSLCNVQAIIQQLYTFANFQFWLHDMFGLNNVQSSDNADFK